MQLPGWIGQAWLWEADEKMYLFFLTLTTYPHERKVFARAQEWGTCVCALLEQELTCVPSRPHLARVPWFVKLAKMIGPDIYLPQTRKHTQAHTNGPLWPTGSPLAILWLSRFDSFPSITPPPTDTPPPPLSCLSSPSAPRSQSEMISVIPGYQVETWRWCAFWWVSHKYPVICPGMMAQCE